MTRIADRLAASQPRSWLFAPGHNQKLLNRVFEADADAVMLDLEDAVPASMKATARAMVVEVAATRTCWVRINRSRTAECELDVAALAGLVAGFRLPKVESADDVQWVASLAPGVLIDCTIESARGVHAAFDIASAPACSSLSYGGLDLANDLGIQPGDQETLFARSSIVISARAANKPQPSDGVYPLIRDDSGLEAEARAAKRLGFFGKSAIHPRQIPIINQVFSPAPEELEWAAQVIVAFEASGGAATALESGEFVDKPVADRARRLLGS